LIVGVVGCGLFGGEALAQAPGGGCQRGGMGGSPGTQSMMMPQSANNSSGTLSQTQLAYQYQMQLAYLQQQAELERAYLKEQSQLAAKKQEYRERRLAERRLRKESDKARRLAAKANSSTRTSTDGKLAVLK